jgi:hypothetical protein
MHKIPLQASGWNYSFGHWLSRLNITSQCSGDKHGCEKWLTEQRGIRYARNQDKAAFFTNLMTVLSLSDFLGGARTTVSGSGERSLASLSPHRPRKWQNRRIIPVEANLPGHIGESRGVRST